MVPPLRMAPPVKDDTLCKVWNRLLRMAPPPPTHPDRMTDTSLWKDYLAVSTVVGGNKNSSPNLLGEWYKMWNKPIYRSCRSFWTSARFTLIFWYTFTFPYKMIVSFYFCICKFVVDVLVGLQIADIYKPCALEKIPKYWEYLQI